MKKILILTLCMLLVCCTALCEALLPAPAEFIGGSIDYEAAYAQYADAMQTYADFGWSTDAADPETVAMEVLEDMVEHAVLRAKAQELGLAEVPESEMDALRETARITYEDQIAYYIDFYASADMTDEEARAVTAEALNGDGMSEADILAGLMEDWWYSALYAYVCDGIAITEQHIWDYADSLAETQALEHADDPSNFDYLYMNGDIIAWYPEGVRRIKHILIGFDADGAKAYEAVVGDGTAAEADPAALDAVYAPLQARADEVAQLLQDGADFNELMRTYGADDYMLYEPYSTDGYMVQPGSQLFVEEFVDACFALENVGDISGPVRSPGGIHYILYAGDVTAGSAALENIVELVADEARDALITDTFDAQVAAWVEEAQPVYHPEYLFQ